MTPREKLLAALREMAESGRLSADDKARVLEAYDAIGGRTPQRMIAERLRAQGVDCRTEVTLTSYSGKSRSGTFRADLAVYRDGKIVALCECKAWARELTGRQREHYERSGFPYLVAGWDNIDEAVAVLAAKALDG